MERLPPAHNRAFHFTMLSTESRFLFINQTMGIQVLWDGSDLRGTTFQCLREIWSVNYLFIAVKKWDRLSCLSASLNVMVSGSVTAKLKMYSPIRARGCGSWDLINGRSKSKSESWCDGEKAEIYAIKEERGVYQNELLERRDDLSENFLMVVLEVRE